MRARGFVSPAGVLYSRLLLLRHSARIGSRTQATFAWRKQLASFASFLSFLFFFSFRVFGLTPRSGLSRVRFENLTRIPAAAPRVSTLLNRVLNDSDVTLVCTVISLCVSALFCVYIYTYLCLPLSPCGFVRRLINLRFYVVVGATKTLIRVRVTANSAARTNKRERVPRDMLENLWTVPLNISPVRLRAVVHHRELRASTVVSVVPGGICAN